MAAGQVTQPVRAAGGTAAIPLTTVVYAATSLTFQRAALPRRSWQPCATWPPAGSPSRAGQCRRALVPQPRPLSDPWRPSESGSAQTDITQEHQSPGVTTDDTPSGRSPRLVAGRPDAAGRGGPRARPGPGRGASAAHSPIAARDLAPASTAQTATPSTPSSVCRRPRRCLGSAMRARSSSGLRHWSDASTASAAEGAPAGMGMVGRQARRSGLVMSWIPI